MFFQTNSGAYFNTQHIAALIPCHDSGKKTRLEIVTSGGTTHIETIFNTQLEDLLKGPQMVPAVQGYECVAWGMMECGDDYVCRSPIVGWRLDDLGVANPVAIETFSESEQAVLSPDGRVIARGEGAYDTVEEWRAENRRLRDERIARAAA